MGPEVIKGEKYSSSIDVYSFGNKIKNKKIKNKKINKINKKN